MVRVVAALLAAGVSGLVARPSAACGGPCTEGDIWDVQPLGEELNVVTNFGLLRGTPEGFHLDCEELFGGLLTGAEFAASSQVASTSVGFFRRGSERCEWDSAVSGASNTWFLDFSLLSSDPEADAGEGADVLALVIDRETQEAKVERSTLGEPFTTLATFPSDSGLRKLVAGGTPTHVYVTGYTFGPRVWHVAFAALGDAFEQRSFDAEGDTSELRPLAVEPNDGHRLWLRSVVTTAGPDSLVSFDTREAGPQEVFTLERDEKLADLAFDGDTLYLAGRGEGSSTVYVADTAALEFEPIATVPATLTCLTLHEGRMLACNSDFTRTSPWLVASSDDRGETWQPLLVLQDLGAVTSCGAVCGTTTGWLYGVFGLLPDGTNPDGGPGMDAGGEPTSDASSGDLPDDAVASGCGCTLVGGGAGHAPNWWWLVLAGLLWRRRRALAPPVLAAWSLGCDPHGHATNHEAGAHHPPMEAGAAACAGRGEMLRGLEVTGADGLALEFVAIEPDPVVVGDNSWQVRLTRGDAPLTGAASLIVVTPRMPDHGHGSPVQVSVVELGEGEYRFSPVNTFMPGYWEVTVELDGDGGVSSLRFGVCVE